jgi:cell division transport system permease protein
LTYRVADAWVVRGQTAPHLIVYLDADVAHDRSQQIQEALHAIPAVEDVRFVSEAEARARLVAFFEDSGSGFDLEPGVLPPSLEVTLESGVREVAELHPLAARLREVAGVSGVEYLDQWSDRRNHLVANLRELMMFLSALLFATSAITTCMVQRLGAVQDADHARVMQICGGTRASARVTSTTRGAMQGFVGALVALGLSYLIYVKLQAPLGAMMTDNESGKSIPYLSLVEMAIFLGAGTFIGAFGGLWATRSVDRA